MRLLIDSAIAAACSQKDHLLIVDWPYPHAAKSQTLKQQCHQRINAQSAAHSIITCRSGSKLDPFLMFHSQAKSYPAYVIMNPSPGLITIISPTVKKRNPIPKNSAHG
jgi:hypothetical protein